METNLGKRIFSIVDHREHVFENCKIIAREYIARGDDKMARDLIVKGMMHDYSKFGGEEWEAFKQDDPPKDKLEAAIRFHNRTNDHHPEYWGGIKHMPELCVAEMMCDFKARAGEFGTSLREWIDGPAAKRYGYAKGDPIYDLMMYFLKILCQEPFSQPAKE